MTWYSCLAWCMVLSSNGQIVLHCMVWPYRVMARYCRKIDGKYFAVLAHARNGWQEHKYQADADDDDERMILCCWTTWSRFEIGIDLAGAARVPASSASHRRLLIEHCSIGSSLLAAHWTKVCSLLTELGVAIANSFTPLWIVRASSGDTPRKNQRAGRCYSKLHFIS